MFQTFLILIDIEQIDFSLIADKHTFAWNIFTFATFFVECRPNGRIETVRKKKFRKKKS